MSHKNLTVKDYPPVNKQFAMENHHLLDLPMKHGDFRKQTVELPEGRIVMKDGVQTFGFRKSRTTPEDFVNWLQYTSPLLASGLTWFQLTMLDVWRRKPMNLLRLGSYLKDFFTRPNLHQGSRAMVQVVAKQMGQRAQEM